MTPKSLWDGKAKVTASSSTVTVSGSDITIQPGDDAYPGITIEPSSPWDLSGYGHVEAKIRNTGATPLGISLRVDNAGDWKDNPWNAESVIVSAGKTATVTTIFGYSYGMQPGFKLNPSSIPRILLFTSQPSEPVAFRIESIVAAGLKGEKPPVASNDVRVKPKGGLLFGPGIAIDAAKQLSGASLEGGAIRVETTPVSFRPTEGRWDLGDFDAVRVTLRNTGTNAASPKVRLDSNGGTSEDWVSPSAPLKPGSTVSLIVPFSSKPSVLGKEKEIRISSDAVSEVSILPSIAGTFLVEKIEAITLPLRAPAWLGKRPPVEGEWIKTLDDEFDGKALNDKIWNVKGENYYDKVSHWSKDNVLIDGGAARLRYEKRKGFQNDDPKRNETPYATGYLDTYGKWTQKYGYFEARMKLPTAPGLWPAFWMMPDRGEAAGEQWKRQDTANGGMEFDIMEHLTRWGGRRYNIAMHYDGYEKEHKSLGSDKVYVQPDKDGFITCGLLWTPGEAVYYCNGKEVLRWKDPCISDVASDLMFTLPSGGWDNNAIDDEKLPSDFVIDYVRAWQRKDLR